MNIKEANIWKIASCYRSFVLSDDIVPATIRMVFSKYSVDNYLFAETKEEMTFYADAQKAISSGDAIAYINTLNPIMNMIDKKTNSNWLLKDIPLQITDDIFGGYNKKKTYDAGAASKAFMQIISSIDFTENEYPLFDELLEFIYSTAERTGKRSGEYVTNSSVNKLAKVLLKVDANDVYKDFACGYGLSSFEIICDDVKKAYLSDINHESVQIALMLSIIRNKCVDKFVFKVINALNTYEENPDATKVFVDFPLNIKCNKDQYGTTDGNILAMSKVVENLKENGKAVITCPSGLLFKETKEVTEFRKRLIEQGVVEAVVTLPQLMYGASVNVNMLVLSKRNNRDVVVVDASNNKHFQFSNNARSNKTELTSEGIKKIVEIINKKEEIIGLSKIISGKKMIDRKTFVPASYLDLPKKNLPISSREINEKLNDLYSRLKELQ